MGLALVFSLYDCCPLTPPTLTHANTKLHPNNSPKVGQCLSFCLMTHFRQIGSYVIKRNEAIGGDDAELGTLKLTGDIQAKVRLCLITFTPVVLLFRASSCFSVSLFPQQEQCIITHTSGLSAPHCTASPKLPGRYLSIKIYCVRGEGSFCVCIISDSVFLQWKLFQFAVLEDTAAAQ